MLNVSSKSAHYDREQDSKRHRSYKSKNDELLLLKRPTILSKSRGDPDRNTPQKPITIINKKDENLKPLTKSDSFDNVHKQVVKLDLDMAKLVLKPANQQSAPKPILIQQPATPSKDSVSIHSRLTTPHMKNACKLLDDNLQFIDSLDHFLSESNESYTVIGVLGKRGVGKSSLLSMLAGCDKSDFLFKSAGLESDGPKTSGVDAFISKERTIFLDFQPLLSATASVESNKKGVEFKYFENYVQIQSIELACFCLSVCNVVLLMEDWFTDPNLLTLVHTAEMLLPNMTDTDQTYEHHAHLFYCLNKCDYLSRVDLIKMKSVFANLMKDSKLSFKGSLNAEFNSVANPCFLRQKKSSKNADDVNFVILPSYKSKTERKLFTILLKNISLNLRLNIFVEFCKIFKFSLKSYI